MKSVRTQNYKSKPLEMNQEELEIFALEIAKRLIECQGYTVLTIDYALNDFQCNFIYKDNDTLVVCNLIFGKQLDLKNVLEEDGRDVVRKDFDMYCNLIKTFKEAHPEYKECYERIDKFLISINANYEGFLRHLKYPVQAIKKFNSYR